MIMLMEVYVIYIALILVGLCLGSFGGATVWRLRARQLQEDKAAGEPVDAKEYKRLQELTKHTGAKDRSRCLHCKHELAWYDLIPLVSWVSLRGKCRYCHTPIGYFEPIIELAVAGFFAVSYALWPTSLDSGLAIAQFVLWLLAGAGLAILFSYDLKWFLLPDRVMFPVIVLAALYAITMVIQSSDMGAALVNLLGSAVILSGLYFAVYVVSRGGWIGFGDIKLGLALALLLADWKLAFLALFAANLVGCIIVIPGLVSRKITRQTRIPFGPLLIVGFLIAAVWGNTVVTWYMGSLGF